MADTAKSLGKDDTQFLDELRSRQEIERLVAEYCHGCDKHDLDRFLAIWHPDAAWKIGEPYGDFYGTADIRRGLELVWSALPQSHHWTTNLVIDFDDGEHAHAISDCTADGEDAEARTITISATYYDKFERRNGRWAFSDRTCNIHYFKALQLEEFSGLTVSE